MKKSAKSILLFFVVTCVEFSSAENYTIAACDGFEVTQAKVNQDYTRSISKNAHQVFRYEFSDGLGLTDPDDANLKVYAEVDAKYDDLTKKCPLHFTIRQQADVKAWELPIFVENPEDKSKPFTVYRKVERSLCLPAGQIIKENDLLVMISTCSETPFEYNLRVEVTYDMFLPSQERVNTSVTLYSPIFYRFNYSEFSYDSPVIIKATSEDKACMVLSIQKPECPLLDTENTVRFSGHWQTMSTQAAITVPRDYVASGFFVVLVVLSDNSDCDDDGDVVPATSRSNYWKKLRERVLERNDPQIRSKTVSLYVKEVMDEDDYILPILLPLSFYAVLIILVFVTFVVFHHLKLRISKTGMIDEVDAKQKGLKSKLRATVFISDFVKADYRSLQKKSKQYFWSVTLVAVFYCSPVVQQIFNYVQVLYKTGEHDLCYYNFLCAHPYQNIMDFNHLYSNVGYVLLGLTFMVFVRLRHGSMKRSAEFKNQQVELEVADRYKLEQQRNCCTIMFPVQEDRLNHGVLQHYGLFYAMGVALVMEGLLSGSYHLCPNQNNFQYDTSFMYVISVLGLVKVYQFRHPVNVNANILLLILALVAIYTMFGLLFENYIFKIVFSVLYMFFVFNILTYLYYVGYLKNQDEEVITNWLSVYRFVLSKWWDDLKTKSLCLPWSRSTWTLETDSDIIKLKTGPNRVLLPILGIILNCTVIVLIWTLMSETDFATEVLAILIVNFVGYTGYYAVMKYIHNEYSGKVWLQTSVYGIISVVLWIFSLNFFRQGPTSWEKSPAESKVLNQECFFMDFYDQHDVWHFLSAGAMFCSFMVKELSRKNDFYQQVLFTLDDDLIYTPQSKIPVF